MATCTEATAWACAKGAVICCRMGMAKAMTRPRMPAAIIRSYALNLLFMFNSILFGAAPRLARYLYSQPGEMRGGGQCTTWAQKTRTRRAWVKVTLTFFRGRTAATSCPARGHRRCLATMHLCSGCSGSAACLFLLCSPMCGPGGRRLGKPGRWACCVLLVRVPQASVVALAVAALGREMVPVLALCFARPQGPQRGPGRRRRCLG